VDLQISDTLWDLFVPIFVHDLAFSAQVHPAICTDDATPVRTASIPDWWKNKKKIERNFISSEQILQKLQHQSKYRLNKPLLVPYCRANLIL
jgi:hypothetical protein